MSFEPYYFVGDMVGAFEQDVAGSFVVLEGVELNSEDILASVAQKIPDYVALVDFVDIVDIVDFV